MNVALKTSFTIALFAICLLGLTAMAAQPTLTSPASASCPVTLTPCTEDPSNLHHVGTCQYLNWGTCEVYSTAPLGQLGQTCQCDCTW